MLKDLLRTADLSAEDVALLLGFAGQSKDDPHGFRRILAPVRFAWLDRSHIRSRLLPSAANWNYLFW